MKCIDVKWMHESQEHPVRLVSELDERQMETRKLEFFTGGRVGHASAAGHSPGTELSIEPIPDLDEINRSQEFLGVAIELGEFEKLWAQNVSHGA